MDRWGPEFKASKVSACTDEWAKIFSDYKLLSGIPGYKLEFSEPPVQARAMPEIKFDNIGSGNALLLDSSKLLTNQKLHYHYHKYNSK